MEISRCTVPAPHAEFLDCALPRLRDDARIVGVAAGGSYLSGVLDEWSDLDLVVALEPSAYAAGFDDGRAIAERLGPLLAAFTGEHVGEPRLLICLYGPPLLHVDLKFVSLDDAASRVEDPCVLWERDGRLTAALAGVAARFPAPDLQWIEDRFWIWIHYGAAKVGRGEIFEALDCLAFLRERALGPLALQSRGARASGVRRIETVAPELAVRLRSTVATCDARSCLAALRAAAEIYRELRATRADPELRIGALAEGAAIAYLRGIEAGLSPR